MTAEVWLALVCTVLGAAFVVSAGLLYLRLHWNFYWFHGRGKWIVGGLGVSGGSLWFAAGTLIDHTIIPPVDFVLKVPGLVVMLFSFLAWFSGTRLGQRFFK